MISCDRKLGALTTPLLAVAFALLSGCGGDSGPSSASQTSATTDVGADLLGSRVDIGAGMPSTVPVAGRPSASGAAPTLDELGWTIGTADAPIRIIEFSDFGCGYCRKFHEETFPTLEAEYIDTGKVLWKFVPMILGIFGPNSQQAALAGECAGEQGSFEGMRSRLFGTQSTWKGSDDPAPHFRSLASQVVGDLPRWEQCMNEGWQTERVNFGTALSREVGVRGTPTFFVVGYQPIPGAIPLDLFREVLDTVYAQKTSSD